MYVRVTRRFLNQKIFWLYLFKEPMWSYVSVGITFRNLLRGPIIIVISFLPLLFTRFLQRNLFHMLFLSYLNYSLFNINGFLKTDGTLHRNWIYIILSKTKMYKRFWFLYDIVENWCSAWSRSIVSIWFQFQWFYV